MISPRVPEFSLACELVLAHSWNPIAYQILNPGIQRWLSEHGDGLIGYVPCHHIRVVAGAPVCNPARIREIAREFEADAERNRQRVCYFYVGPRFISIVRDLPRFSFAAIGSFFIALLEPVGVAFNHPIGCFAALSSRALAQ